MQAIIMAAGRGSRLGDMTKDTPKCLLKIQGKRLLDINIDMLHRYGIWDITIVTGFQDQKIESATKDIPGIRLVYNPFYEHTNVIGSYYMGMNNLHDDFIYLHADTVCDHEIFENLLKSEGDVVLPVDTKPCDEEAMKIKLEGQNIIRITKQMPCEDAVGEFIGIAKIRRNVILDLNDSAKNVLRDRDYKAYFEEALQRIIDMKKYDIRIIETEDRFWGEVDFLEDYQKVLNNISLVLLK